MMEDLKKFYRVHFFDEIRLLRREMKGMGSVLDLGCGYNSLLQYCQVPESVGVEIFPDYIKQSQAKGIHTRYVQGDINTVEFPDRSFDAVYCSEVIEHLTKADGEVLLQKMSRWARREVIVVTPNGFVEQGAYHENEHQKHLSGWTPKDFMAFGFRVYGINGLRSLRRVSLGNFPFLAKIYFQVMFLLTRFVYFFPGRAFQLFAVKETADE
jgi:ubiquinone/menaquinone biosynthesis C-methylase UbiE